MNKINFSGYLGNFSDIGERYGCDRFCGYWENKGNRYFAPNYLSFGDYCGSLVEKSNIEVWKESLPTLEGIVWSERREDYSTTVIVIDTRAAQLLARIADEDSDAGEELAKMAKLLSELARYPLLDEDLHSELETAAQNKAWTEDYYPDFRRAVERALADKGFDYSMPTIWDTWEIFSEWAGDGYEWLNEESDCMVLRVGWDRDIDDFAECLAEKIEQDWIDSDAVIEWSYRVDGGDVRTELGEHGGIALARGLTDREKDALARGLLSVKVWSAVKPEP